MFVHPEQVAAILKCHPQVLRARLVVSGAIAAERLCLYAETADGSATLATGLIQTIRDLTKLRGEVEFVAPGSLPNDGRVIEDARNYA